MRGATNVVLCKEFAVGQNLPRQRRVAIISSAGDCISSLTKEQKGLRDRPAWQTTNDIHHCSSEQYNFYAAVTTGGPTVSTNAEFIERLRAFLLFSFCSVDMNFHHRCPVSSQLSRVNCMKSRK